MSVQGAEKVGVVRQPALLAGAQVAQIGVGDGANVGCAASFGHFRRRFHNFTTLDFGSVKEEVRGKLTNRKKK